MGVRKRCEGTAIKPLSHGSKGKDVLKNVFFASEIRYLCLFHLYFIPVGRSKNVDSYCHN